MQKVATKVVETDSESESEIEEFDDAENRLSDDEDFPMSEDEQDSETEVNQKKGWASSMAKILNSEKVGVLSKAKKVEDVAKKKEKKSYNFEIEGEDEKDEAKPSEKALKIAMQRRKLRERREVR